MQQGKAQKGEGSKFLRGGGYEALAQKWGRFRVAWEEEKRNYVGESLKTQ